MAELDRARRNERTILDAIGAFAANDPSRVVIRPADSGRPWTYGYLWERAERLASGLVELGLGRDETVALLLSNRPEFHLVDLAVLFAGGVPVSLYGTAAPEQMSFVVEDAGASILICERASLAQAAAVEDSGSIRQVVSVDEVESGAGESGSGVLSIGEVEAGSTGLDGHDAVSRISSDDLITLIYTSGTTGSPKGVELTHANVQATLDGLHAMIDFPGDARLVSWLPAAHIAERNIHHYLPLSSGFETTPCPEPQRILDFLPRVRPSWFFAVPRIWEKLRARIEARIASIEAEERAAILTALQRGGDHEVLAGLRRWCGLDALVVAHAGAAPTPPETLEFLHTVGIPVGELWGMSETCGAGTLTRPGEIRIGTVGPPYPEIEMSVADDGELLVSGEVVMKGYRGLPDATAKAFDAEGRLRTGDLAEIEADGHVKIVGRRKEIIINSAGKNMSPISIEATVKSASRLFDQVAVIGDARPYNVALITLDPENLAAWARSCGRSGEPASRLLSAEQLRDEIARSISRANERLARVEQLKDYRVLAGEWHPGGDELTPTMKLKREVIAEKYAAEIEAMYDRADVARFRP